MNSEIKRVPSAPTWARIILSIVAFFLVMIPFQFLGLAIIDIPITQENITNMSMPNLLVMQACSLIGTLIVVIVFRRYMDRRSIISMGFSIRKRTKDILLGLGIAVGLMGIGFLVLVFTNHINAERGMLSINFILQSFIMFILVSLNEEIFVRGYILNNLMGAMNKYGALALSSMIFMIFHLLNSNLNLVGVVNLFLAGILLGSAYIYTKNLWFPLSLHLFWNFFQGPIFGFNVSGQQTNSLTKLSYISSNDLITGGKFGFEGSIICTILTIVCTSAIIFYFEKKQKPHTAM